MRHWQKKGRFSASRSHCITWSPHWNKRNLAVLEGGRDILFEQNVHILLLSQQGRLSASRLQKTLATGSGILWSFALGYRERGVFLSTTATTTVTRLSGPLCWLKQCRLKINNPDKRYFIVASTDLFIGSLLFPLLRRVFRSVHNHYRLSLSIWLTILLIWSKPSGNTKAILQAIQKQ